MNKKTKILILIGVIILLAALFLGVAAIISSFTGKTISGSTITGSSIMDIFR